MASITLGGNPINTAGELPKVGSKLADFKLVKNDLSVASLSDFSGKKLVLNIFPSIDTGTCATSVRKFRNRRWICKRSHRRIQKETGRINETNCEKSRCGHYNGINSRKEGAINYYRRNGFINEAWIDNL